jgi:hypothetical protein
VGEVRQPGRAVDERQAERAQRDHEAELDARDRQLGCLLPDGGRLPGALAQREDHDPVVRGRFDVRGDGHLLGIGQADALREGVHVDSDVVVALARDLDEPGAVLGTGRRALEPVAGHGDGHPADRGLAALDPVLEPAADRLAFGGRGLRQCEQGDEGDEGSPHGGHDASLHARRSSHERHTESGLAGCSRLVPGSISTFMRRSWGIRVSHVFPFCPSAGDAQDMSRVNAITCGDEPIADQPRRSGRIRQVSRPVHTGRSSSSTTVTW